MKKPLMGNFIFCAVCVSEKPLFHLCYLNILFIILIKTHFSFQVLLSNLVKFISLHLQGISLHFQGISLHFSTFPRQINRDSFRKVVTRC